MHAQTRELKQRFQPQTTHNSTALSEMNYCSKDYKVINPYFPVNAHQLVLYDTDYRNPMQQFLLKSGSGQILR